MDIAGYLKEYSLPGTLLSLLILLFCLKQIGELLEWFSDKTGLQTRGLRKYKEMETKVERHDQAFKDLADQMKELSKKIDNLSNETLETRKESDHRRMKELRNNIWNFENTMRERHYDKERCDAILEEHDEYECLIKRWGEQNGKTTRAIESIKEYRREIE